MQSSSYRGIIKVFLKIKLAQMNKQTNSKKWLPWLMWGLGTCFYCYEFFLQVSPSVMVHDLMHDFKVTATALGNLTAFYMYAYAIMQIPVGIMIDRYGARRLLTIACLLCAGGALTFGLAPYFAVAAIGRTLIGIGSAFAAVGCMHLAASWLPLNRFALTTGLLLTIGMLGAALGEGPLSTIIPTLGWRKSLIIFGLIGLGLSALIYSLVRDRNVHENALLNPVLPKSFFSGLKHVVRNKSLWVISLYGGLMFSTVPGFAGLWGVPFLMRFYSLEKTTAAFFCSMVFIGFAIGAPLFGWFSDRIGRRKTPMYVACIGSLITITPIIYASDLSHTFLVTLLFGFGFFMSAFLPMFSLAREINPPEVNATALGFANTMNSVGAAFSQLMVGVLLDITWDGYTVADIRIYSSSDYHFAMTLFPAAIGLALITLFFVKETYCKPHYVSTDE